MRCFLFLLILFPYILYGQDTIPSRCSLNGYVTNMQSFMFQRWDGDWTSDNFIHNRINYIWHNTSNTINVVSELRNRFITGESVKTIPGYANIVNADDGYLELSHNISTGKSYIFNSKVDRLYLDYTHDKLQVRVGRQRINWGQCFTWNPNDLFNTYSFFDFDYIEKPGCDAVRLQYYMTNTSGFEFAIKADSARYITSAALYHFNKWNYDIQFLGGFYNNEDYIIGVGWSGNIKDASFRGEISYFRPKTKFTDTTGTIVFSFGSEYTFRNSLTLQGEILYNQIKNIGQSSFFDFNNMGLSAKKLSFTPFSLMLQGSYPVTPLFNVSISGMYFPKIKGFFIAPSFSYSVTNNIDFSFIVQSFVGQMQKGEDDSFHMAYVRVKWNF